MPLRKPGKLPGKTISEKYSLEYGKDEIEMHVGAVKEGQRVLLIDDLIASGGTMAAGLKLMGVLTLMYMSVSRSFAERRLCPAKSGDYDCPNDRRLSAQGATPEP